MQYQVIIGNIGTVLNTTDKLKAEKTYKAYMYDSDDGVGRAGGEEVTLMGDGEVIRAFNPENKE